MGEQTSNGSFGCALSQAKLREASTHLSGWLASESNGKAKSSQLNADDTGTTFGVPVL